jgi:hypothetical protein
VKVRTIERDDYEAVQQLKEKHGLSTAPRPEWEASWDENPIVLAGTDLPRGWVVTDDMAQIVGILDNIPMAYSYQGKPVTAAASGSWAVDEDYRSAGGLLLMRFLRQKHVDLILTTTANEASGKALQALRAQAVPHPEYDTTLFWITHYRGFASAYARGAIPLGAAIVGAVGGLALWAYDSVRGPKPQLDPEASVQRVEAFDQRFDEFWSSLRDSSDKLVAVRDRAALAWHFRTNPPLIFAHVVGERITSYMILDRADNPNTGLERLRVVDCQALDGALPEIAQLIAAALDHARKTRIHLVEVVGLHRTKRIIFEALKPRKRNLPTQPFFFYARNKSLRSILQEEDRWDPSPFDGDAAL